MAPPFSASCQPAPLSQPDLKTELRNRAGEEATEGGHTGSYSPLHFLLESRGRRKWRAGDGHIPPANSPRRVSQSAAWVDRPKLWGLAGGDFQKPKSWRPNLVFKMLLFSSPDKIQF